LVNFTFNFFKRNATPPKAVCTFKKSAQNQDPLSEGQNILPCFQRGMDQHQNEKKRPGSPFFLLFIVYCLSFMDCVW
jgi:hypothetical protein